jgi:hypothetical protein
MLHVFALATVAVLKASVCTSALDCGLNGECINNSCRCEPGWTSANCTVLDLAPARWGRERQARMTNHSSWGGNAVRDADGIYHLVFSELKEGGLHSFQTTCEASSAVSADPLGPFVRPSTNDPGNVRGLVTHNVQPQLGPDGALYVFAIGNTSDGGNIKQIVVGRAPKSGAGWDTQHWEWVRPNMTDLQVSARPALLQRATHQLRACRRCARRAALPYFNVLTSACAGQADYEGQPDSSHVRQRLYPARHSRGLPRVRRRRRCARGQERRGCPLSRGQLARALRHELAQRAAVRQRVQRGGPVPVAHHARLPPADARPPAVPLPQAGAGESSSASVSASSYPLHVEWLRQC